MAAFQTWLLEQVNDKRLSYAEASVGAGLNRGAVSFYLAGNRPSAASCKKLADFFEVPAEQVLYLAGYVSAPPDHDLFLKQVSELTQGLTPAERQQVIEVLKALRKR